MAEVFRLNDRAAQFASRGQNKGIPRRDLVAALEAPGRQESLPRHGGDLKMQKPGQPIGLLLRGKSQFARMPRVDHERIEDLPREDQPPLKQQLPRDDGLSRGGKPLPGGIDQDIRVNECGRQGFPRA